MAMKQPVILATTPTRAAKDESSTALAELPAPYDIEAG
jgi:hypothetical protein